MAIRILKYKSRTEKQKPVEYIGIVVETLSPSVSGRINLISFLKHNAPDALATVSMTSPSEYVIHQVLGKQSLGYENGADIHIIECYQTVSSIFGVPENALPSPKDFYDYVNKVTNSYEMSYAGELEIKISMPKLSALLASAPSESTSSAALTTNGMFSSTAKASKEESTKEKHQFRCVIM